MGKRLYVGSLPFDVTEAQLQELFVPCGQVVSAKLISDKYTGQSKGFGFVEMATEAEAQAAIQKMNSSTVGSRQIIVNEARPMEPRSPGGGGGFGGRREGGFCGGQDFGGGKRGGGGGGGKRGGGKRGGGGGGGGGFDRW